MGTHTSDADLAAAVEGFLVESRVEPQKTAQPPAAAKDNAVAKLNYSHVDMIDCIIANPHISQGQLAARYGYSQSWICQVMQSDAWQSMMAQRRDEIVDPVLKLTVEERVKALTIRSMERLMEKLDAPQVSDATVLKAFELGAKAIGVGGNAAPAAPAAVDHLAQLANRLVDLQAKVRRENAVSLGETYEGSAVQVG